MRGLFSKEPLILRCGDSRLEGALQHPLQLLEPSFEAFAALRHLRMRSADRMVTGRTEPETQMTGADHGRDRD
ncbi:hypothetical protein ASF26_19590 [Methylobacterium sp. Leaf93]|nr:hypothetical protein ASF26_19590 [Methylobacterium sp. Leaf93]